MPADDPDAPKNHGATSAETARNLGGRVCGIVEGWRGPPTTLGWKGVVFAVPTSLSLL